MKRTEINGNRQIRMEKTESGKVKTEKTKRKTEKQKRGKTEINESATFYKLFRNMQKLVQFAIRKTESVQETQKKRSRIF